MKMLIDSYLKRLRLPAIAQHYEALARDAAQNNQPYEAFLFSLLEQEIRQREENRIRTRVRQARFRIQKTLESFDFTAIPSLNRHLVLELHRCEFIRRCENVLFIGNSGTGKTHLATSLGLTACKMDYKVRFYGAAQLVAELIEANDQRQLSKLEKQWLKWDLIIADEVGYIPFSPTGAQLLFQFLSSRHERGSVIITTNLEFAQWTEVLGDERLTTALLDRLTHRAHILVMNGESYRFKESLKQNTIVS
ncbi:MAG: IS21-like element helper ATPase IstB [Firmicutes bacterium]|nr:IS21-like element helper ATPase IstB [Bacillota bacterium]